MKLVLVCLSSFWMYVSQRRLASPFQCTQDLMHVKSKIAPAVRKNVARQVRRKRSWIDVQQAHFFTPITVTDAFPHSSFSPKPDRRTKAPTIPPPFSFTRSPRRSMQRFPQRSVPPPHKNVASCSARPDTLFFSSSESVGQAAGKRVDDIMEKILDMRYGALNRARRLFARWEAAASPLTYPSLIPDPRHAIANTTCPTTCAFPSTIKSRWANGTIFALAKVASSSKVRKACICLHLPVSACLSPPALRVYCCRKSGICPLPPHPLTLYLCTA